MKIYKCVILEDQASAQRILTDYISQTPNLCLENSFVNPLKCLPYLEANSVDILFLDVQLPQISGIEIYKSLSKKPYVILTTAFSEYAVQGFELDVVDYLLKPFSFERFLKAISKVYRKEREEQKLELSNYVFVNSKGSLKKVELNDVLYIESKGDFSVLVTELASYVVDITLRDTLQQYGSNFARTHKSFVINTDNIELITGNTIKTKKADIPIGRSYKEALMKKLGR